MANRVLLGQRNSEMGLWISRPGFDVLTAGENDMLFLATPTKQTKAFQIIQTGLVSWGSGQLDVDVPCPNLGYNTMATGYFYGNAGLVYVVYPYPGLVRFTRYWHPSAGTPLPRGPYYYFITNLKMP